MRFALVSMPLFSCHKPSLQLARIQGQVRKLGHEAQCFYLNVHFAVEVGPGLYNAIYENSDILLGHWLFSRAVPEVNTSPESAREYLKEFSSRFKGLEERLFELHDQVAPNFIQRWARQENWGEFDFIGFTCTFSQLVPALALAHAIKKIHPHVKIVLGGAEVQSHMGEEVLRQCSYVDYVVDGEGENAVAQLIETPSRGVIKSEEPVHLDDLDFPDYGEFFDLVEGLNDETILGNSYAIPIEGSRGCWWGQKHHCTFCGLNGEDLKFRRRSADSIYNEIVTQSRAYERYEFEFVDNILDYKLHETLLPKLAANRGSLKFFAETKSNLKLEDVLQFKNAGFFAIQPGIESLSTKTLRIMKKGVTASQNLDLLKWGTQHGVRIIWNLLYGFPGEADQDYRNLSEILKKIVHLQPPQAAGRIRIDRFSPYFNGIKDRRSSDFDELGPAKAYSLIYPSHWNLWDLAYFFEGRAKNNVQTETYNEISEIVNRWVSSWTASSKPSLVFKRAIGHGHVIDQRSDQSDVFQLDGPAFQIAVCLSESSKTIETISRQTGIYQETVEEIIGDLSDLGFCVELDEKITFLPLLD